MMSRSTSYVLAALAGERLYGYAIIERVLDLSGGEVVLTAGTLYGALERMVGQGLVVRDGEEIVDGRARRYYRLTERGAAALSDESVRMRRAANAADRRLRARAATA